MAKHLSKIAVKVIKPGNHSPRGSPHGSHSRGNRGALLEVGVGDGKVS